MDDLIERSEASRDRIDIDEAHEVNYWAGKFGLQPDALRAIMKASGPMAKDVQAYLSRRTGAL